MKINKKSLFMIILSLLLIFFISSCGKNTSNKEKSYNVIFKNYEEIIQEIKVKEGSLLKEPTIDSVEDYTFLGWYNGDDKWRFSIDTVKQDMTLVTKYEKEQETPIVEDIPPVYQGMSIEKSSTNVKTKKHDIKDAIDNELEIITTDKVDYYAQKNEKFNIVVHLYNPLSYEILSFTLNGYKYQSFEFKEGSTSTKLIVEVDAGTKSGIKEYTIDAIKYVDKEDIKDVRMDGNRTVKAGIRYDIVPNVTLIEEELSTTSYQLTVEITDSSNLINLDNGLHFFLFDGTSIVYTKKLSLGINNIKCENLQIGSSYQYMIIGVYDDFSGEGKKSVDLLSNDFDTESAYKITNLTSTNNSINYTITKQEEKSTLKKINLIKDETIIDSKTTTEDIFTNLLSNTTYQLEVIYQ